MSADELTAAVRRLYGHVSHWTPPRWAASSASDPPGRSRADVGYELIQRIADLTADAEGQPRRRVPRLDAELAWGDQLRVVAADLVAAHPPEQALREAASLVEAAHRAL